MSSGQEGPNVDVVLGRCQQGKGSFGMRVEETSPRLWSVTWSFPLSEQRARSEGYGARTLHGTFAAPTVSCCPHCSARSFVKCNCGRVTCWNGATHFTCQWCGLYGPVSGQINSLSTLGDG